MSNSYQGSRAATIASLFFALLLVIGGSVLGQTTFAHDDGTASTEEMPQEIGYAEAPMALKIDAVTVDGATHTAKVQIKLINNSEHFVDTLNYSVEFHKGDALGESGDLFEPLDLTFVQNDTLEPLAPWEERLIDLDVVYPETVEPGTYFAKVAVWTYEHTVSLLAFTEDPFTLVGTGGYLPVPRAYLMIEGERSEISAGKPLEIGVPLTVVYPFEYNTELEARMQTEDLQVYGEFYSISFEEEALGKTEPRPLDSFIDGETVAIDFAPLESMKPGPYILKVRFVDEAGVQIASDTYVRWLINGFYARIQEVEGSANFYEKGQYPDMTVRLVFPPLDVLEMEDRDLSVTLDIQTVDNQQLSFTKDVQANNGTEGMLAVTFEDIDFTQDAHIVKIVASVVDRQTGETLDSKEYNYPADAIYAADQGIDPTYILIALGVLFIILGIATLRSRSRTKAGLPVTVRTSILAVLTVLTLVVFGAVLMEARTADASHCGGACSVSISLAFWAAPNGNLGTCPQLTTVGWWGGVFCAHCMNGSVFKTTLYSNGVPITSTYTGWPGNEGGYSNNVQGGPFTHVIGVDEGTPTRRYSVRGWSEHLYSNYCSDASWSVAGGQVSCTPAPPVVNGGCGNANGQVFTYSSYTAGAAAGYQTCASGTYTNAAWNASTLSWMCAGSGGGISSWCSYNVTSDPVNGACGWANGQTFEEYDSSYAAGFCASGGGVNGTWNASYTTFAWQCAGIAGGSSTGWCSYNLETPADGGSTTTTGGNGPRTYEDVDCAEGTKACAGHCVREENECNEDDLIAKFCLVPSIVQSDTDERCLAEWVAQDFDYNPETVVSCTINGAEVPAFTDVGNGIDLVPGNYTLTCVDGLLTQSTTTSCKAIPKFEEF